VGTLRIIAGELKGRVIREPSRSPVRPSASRVREALFDILGGTVAGASVLELYSGSGALGFEALSRGADTVVFVEADGPTAQRLRDNADRLGVAARCVVLQGPALELLARKSLAGPYDLILADPPYVLGQVERLLTLASRRLAVGGQLVLERERGTPPPPPPETVSLTLERAARYGRACLGFYRKS
jgi:16S rRNA (guanine966-N2)-methyltransferase